MAQLLHAHHKRLQQNPYLNASPGGGVHPKGDIVTFVPSADAIDYTEWQQLTRQHHPNIVQWLSAPLGEQLLSTTP